MWPLHYQLKSHWSPPTDYHWRNAWVLSGCGYGRRDECLSPSPYAPSISASGRRCVKAWLVCAFAGFDSSRDIGEEQNLHICVLEMKAFQLAPDAIQHGITEESMILMSDRATVVAHKETGRYCFPSHVWSGEGYFQWSRAALGAPYSKIYKGKKIIVADQLIRLDQVLLTRCLMTPAGSSVVPT